MKQIAFVLGVALGGWVSGCAGDADAAAELCTLPGAKDGAGLAGRAGAACATPLTCGDGQLDAGEACDDGNAEDGDGCDSNCTVTDCGNGVLTAGEDCDDGNDLDGDGCDSNCTATACGNSALTSGETCDDGNTADGDGCSALCQREDLEEIEPNGVSDAPGNPLQITGDTTVHAAIASLGDVDAFQVVVSTPTVVRLETFTSFYECIAQTTLRLTTAAGAAVLTDRGAGIGGCAALVVYLDAGAYIVSVEESGNNATVASYFLQVSFQADRGAEAEAASAAGANDTIATAGAALVGGNNVQVLGSHLIADDVDVYALTVPPRARVRAEVVEDERGAAICESGSVDSYLTLYDEAGGVLAIDDDDGRGRCSLIDGSGAVPLDARARNPTDAPRTYYLAVGSSGNAAAPSQFAYRLQVTMR